MKRTFLSIILSSLVLFIVSCGSAVCSINSCKKEAYADGLCFDHYMLVTEDADANSQKGGEEGNETPEPPLQNEKEFVPTASERLEGVYYIGDTVSMSKSYSFSEGYYDITMTDWGTYVNSALENTGVYVTFEVTNTGDIDISINSSDFEAYVNNYSVELDWLMENMLDATLSPGRQTSGNVYIIMNPNDINSLELELGDAIFRMQETSYQNTDNYLGNYETEETILSDFS